MTGQTTMASVKVDGDKLAEALRRVTPFMADTSPPNLACVYAESSVAFSNSRLRTGTAWLT